MERLKIARNVAILLLIAAAVDFLPGGSRAAETFRSVLSVAFLLGFVYLGIRLYREHRVGIYILGDRQRGMLYGAIAVGVATVAGKERMWQTGFGEFVWFVLIGMVLYTLFAIYRYTRTY